MHGSCNPTFIFYVDYACIYTVVLLSYYQRLSLRRFIFNDGRKDYIHGMIRLLIKVSILLCEKITYQLCVSIFKTVNFNFKFKHVQHIFP